MPHPCALCKAKLQTVPLCHDSVLGAFVATLRCRLTNTTSWQSLLGWVDNFPPALQQHVRVLQATRSEQRSAMVGLKRVLTRTLQGSDIGASLMLNQRARRNPGTSTELRSHSCKQQAASLLYAPPNTPASIQQSSGWSNSHYHLSGTHSETRPISFLPSKGPGGGNAHLLPSKSTDRSEVRSFSKMVESRGKQLLSSSQKLQSAPVHCLSLQS